MKIIEALKELKLIVKKVAHNNADIQRYSSGVSNEKPYFPSEKEQVDAVKALVQSNMDLTKRYLLLKSRIEKTNLTISFILDNENHTIYEWLIIKRKLAALISATFNALNDNAGKERLQTNRNFQGEQSISLTRFYNEEQKMSSLRKWRDIEHNIEAQLEIINATTDLVD